MTLTPKMIKAYYEAFKRKVYVDEPTDNVIIEDSSGNAFSLDVTEEQFMDKIKRSKEAGRNLFYEESKPYEQTTELEVDL